MAQKRKEFESYTKFALSVTEFKKILSVCGTLEEEVLMRLAVDLGLRRMDISKIKIANIDLTNGKLTFHEHKKRRDRTLPLSPKLTQKIGQYIKTLPTKSEYLFPWGKSKYGDYSAHRKFNDLCKRAGIPPPPGRTSRPFHSLRGTAYKFKQNVYKWSPVQAAYLLGDTPETAMRHYGTPSDSDIADLMRSETDISGEDDI